MLTTNLQFMVDFTLPDSITKEFIELVPFQKLIVEQYLEDGKLVNYAQSLDNAKVWAIFNASSELEVLEMLVDFPLTPFMGVEVNLLTSFSTNESTPPFSLN